MSAISVATIGDLQAGIAEALEAIRAGVPLPQGLENLRHLAPPRGFISKVSFHRASDDRKIREDASSDYWSPDEAYVQIEFVAPQSREHVVSVDASEKAVRSSEPDTDTRLKDLVLALDLAERDPSFRHFVALKAFRDDFLPKQGYAWAGLPGNRHEALREAIAQHWVLKSQIQNPKAPQFPVTGIRVNRNLPEVTSILDRNRRASPFAPIRFTGEPLSRTVIHDRR